MPFAFFGWSAHYAFAVPTVAPGCAPIAAGHARSPALPSCARPRRKENPRAMKKPLPLFAMYLRGQFLGIQPAKSAAVAKSLCATRGRFTNTGDLYNTLEARPATPEEIQRCCRQCHLPKPNLQKGFCSRCFKAWKQHRRRLIALLRNPAPKPVLLPAAK